MRITFLLPGVCINGAVQSTLELANHLQRRGHKVSVAYPLVPERELAGVFDIRKHAHRAQFLAKNLLSRGKVTWFDLEASLLCPPVLRDGRLPDSDIIVATCWYNAYCMAGYREAAGRKVYLLRNYETWGGPEEAVESTYTMPFHRIATSTWLKETVEGRFGVPVDGPVPNGLDSSIFFHDKPGFERHEPTRIGLLYRREFWKGMDDGLQALSMVREKRRGLQIVLFGNRLKHSDRPLVEGLGGAEWRVGPYGTGLRDIYDSLDIFVFPSVFEGFGNPPLEAMARGVACVTTNVGGIPDYSVDGKTALWVPPGQPRRLAEAILALVDDEAMRRSIAKAGCLYVRRFTWDTSAERLEEVFERILASG